MRSKVPDAQQADSGSRSIRIRGPLTSRGITPPSRTRSPHSGSSLVPLRWYKHFVAATTSDSPVAGLAPLALRSTCRCNKDAHTATAPASWAARRCIALPATRNDSAVTASIIVDSSHAPSACKMPSNAGIAHDASVRGTARAHCRIEDAKANNIRSGCISGLASFVGVLSPPKGVNGL